MKKYSKKDMIKAFEMGKNDSYYSYFESELL